MEIEENFFCRLCAKLQPSCKCLYLQDDSTISQEIVQKLNKLRLEYLDILDQNLPQTVCFECLASLNTTVKFFNCIEKAQKVLKKVFVASKIKRDFDDFASDFDLEVDSKGNSENIELKTEPDEEDINEHNTECLDETNKDTEPEEVTDEDNNEALEDTDEHNNEAIEDTDEHNTERLEVKNEFIEPQEETDEPNTECQQEKIMFTEPQEETNEQNRGPQKEKKNKKTTIKKVTNRRKIECLEEKNENAEHEEVTNEHSSKPQKRRRINKNSKINDDIEQSNLKNTWEHYSWLCAICNLQYPTMKELISHAVVWHCNCCVFKCTDCNRRKLRHDTFITHVMKHRKHLRYSCHVCFKFCGSNKDLAAHFKQHTMFDHICSGCNASFPTNTELEKHIEKFYIEKGHAVKPKTKVVVTEADLTCKICNKKFNTIFAVKLHLRIHSDRKRDHVCDQCGKSYYDKHSLNLHLLGHSNIKPHQCKICKHSFLTLRLLRKHVVVHEGANEGAKPFSCEKCDKSFRLKHLLTTHMAVHSDVLPYICTVCEKGFRLKHYLNLHIRQHTGVQPYSCDICPRPFTNWPNYNKHMKRRHGKNMAKKTKTAKGWFPLDPVTGEVNMATGAETEEWKRAVLEKKTKMLKKPDSAILDDQQNYHFEVAGKMSINK